MGPSTEAPRASAATLAKGALRRLGAARLEPTPENYARAYAEEGGHPPLAADLTADAAPALASALATTNAWAELVDRLAKNLQRGGRQWTSARRQDSLRRVLDGSRSDANRLQQRLSSLMAAWESDSSVDPAAAQADGAASAPVDSAGKAAAATEPTHATAGHWPPLVAALEATLRSALPAHEDRKSVV